MESATLERPRPVTVIGWTFLVLALLRLLQDGVGYLYWRLGGLREGIPIPGAPDPRSPLHSVDVLVRHLGPLIAAQAAAAAVVAIVAWNFLRLRSWARPAMETICWIGLLLLAAFAAIFIVFWEHVGAAASAPDAAKLKFLGPIGVGGSALVVGALLGVTIRFLRRTQVRRAFEGPSE